MDISIRIGRICSTPEEREAGLQDVHLPDRECAVFVFDGPKVAKFWGKNTLQDIYVSFVSDGVVIGCEKIAMMDCSPVSAPGMCDMAIESSVRIPVWASVSFSDGNVRFSF